MKVWRRAEVRKKIDMSERFDESDTDGIMAKFYHASAVSIPRNVQSLEML